MKNDDTVKRIKELMGNLSQEKFAKTINCSQSEISRILSGSSPSITILTRIAKTYEVSVDWLLGLSSKKELNKYSKYNEEKTTTYADISAFIYDLLNNDSVSFVRKQKEYEFEESVLGNSSDCSHFDYLEINDHFIGDLVNAANTLIRTNPESTKAWQNIILQDYDIPLMKWNKAKDLAYNTYCDFKSPLEILKELSTKNI